LGFYACVVPGSRDYLIIATLVESANLLIAISTSAHQHIKISAHPNNSTSKIQLFLLPQKNNLESFITYICLTGMFLPFVILFYNKGYLSANRYLAGYLFFAALYLLENFSFFYGKSLFGIACFTTTHAFFYLIGPFSYFYVRSILTDNSKISKYDFLNYALFAVSFLG
jgi:hypothetical protein